MKPIPHNPPSLTVVVPIYNEAAALKDFLPDLIKTCQMNGWQAVLVNDGSTDDTDQLLTVYQEQSGVTVIRHKLNRGYGRALKTGIMHTTTTHLVTIDGDGQHDVSDIDPVFHYALDNDADLVVGLRSNVKYANPARQLGKWLIRIFTRILMPLPIHDLNSGFKLYRTDLAQKYLTLCPDSMAFSDLITLAFLNQRNLVLEYPISVRQRQIGKSTIGVHTAFETVLEITNLVLLFNPLRIFIPLSIACILFGLVWGGHIVLQGRGVSVGAMLAIVTGVLFAILGLIASQLSSIRLSLLDAPHFYDKTDE